MDGSDAVNHLTREVIGSAIQVHRTLGPGLLEHTYVRCLKYELEKRGRSVEKDVSVNLQYEELLIEGAYRLDLLVDDMVIVEVKAVEKILPVHHSQVLTYLKLTPRSIGLLINFNTIRLVDGLKRFIHWQPASRPTEVLGDLREEQF